MDKLDKNSKPYTDGEYEDFFKAADSRTIAAEDIVPYSQSLSHLRDIQSGFEYRFDEGREEGFAKGIEEGRAEGRAEEKKSMVLALKAKGMDMIFISEVTGLSPEQIMQL